MPSSSMSPRLGSGRRDVTSPRRSRWAWTRAAAVAGGLLAAGAMLLGARGAPESPPPAQHGELALGAAASAAADSAPQMVLRRLEDPARTVVEGVDGSWVATFTDGARTVALAGPERRFDEPSASHGVSSRTWVRLLDAPFDGEVDGRWLEAARQDTSPDVLAVAMQYTAGAPEVRAADGTLVAGAATYGPLAPDGTRPVGSDWSDYQQVTATYPTGVRPPDPRRVASLDCSGYMRMVFGRRFGIPLSSRVDGGVSLPRISYLQASQAPGVVPIPDTGTQVTDLSRLQPGDLVFFDANPDLSRIDHVGLFVGVDDAGGHRFVSSRRSFNGPTMGDHAGPSLLDGDGLYARSFLTTRRL